MTSSTTKSSRRSIKASTQPSIEAPNSETNAINAEADPDHLDADLDVEMVRLARAYAKPFIESGFFEKDGEGARVMFEQSLAPWKAWKVKPLLEPMSGHPPESMIGQRIAYCRGQLDNLPIEALARYTKNFGDGGISRASLVRYESGDTMPGARELRILCDALWVPGNWLLFGVIDSSDENSPIALIAKGLRALIRHESVPASKSGDWIDDLETQNKNKEVETRQIWMDEARKPQPRR